MTLPFAMAILTETSEEFKANAKLQGFTFKEDEQQQQQFQSFSDAFKVGR